MHRERRAFFRTDASARTGGGHVMRCLTLANELTERVFESEFVCASVPEWLHRRLEEAGHTVHRIPELVPDGPNTAGWELVPWPPALQAKDAAATAEVLRHASYDWTVVDHYGLDASWESAVADAGRAARVLVIDDLANRPHRCDLLLDQTPGRNREAYGGLMPAASVGLFGNDYALLRPEFPAAREAALRRRPPMTLERVLISLGAADVGGLTLPATVATLGSVPCLALDVVIGSTAPSLPALRELAAREERITLHVDARDMASLIVHADLAIGAAGTSSWERCCLGLPTLVLILAENQRGLAGQLSQHGAAVVCHDATVLDACIRELASSPARLQKMSTAAAALVDGRGVDRTAKAMHVARRSD